ncbi:hypothetical protein [Microbacterium arborescens]
MLTAALLMASLATFGGGDTGDPVGGTSFWQSNTDGRTVDVGGLKTMDGRFSGPGEHMGSSNQPAPPRDCGALNRCDDFTVSLLPQATLADVASFAPQPAALSSQPAGFAVAGLPVDFVIAAPHHSATGTLFELPVTVRFTPDDIVIAPGDGSTLNVGSTARTSASHVYRSRGSYVATATVRYRAEVDFGRGWRPVPGLLDIPTAGYPIEVLEARGTLVDRTCTEPPSGPGC